MRSLITCCLIYLSLPSTVGAAVVIHEIAWMGSVSSANHEWIELYNDGEAAVSLEGWSLEDGANVVIPLSGTIAAGAYAVLERTSEDSAPGSAFLLYTGALVNTGATLTLFDATRSIMDRVAGGAEWQDIGGDNITKETAQYTTKGWTTAGPTPGQANHVSTDTDMGNPDSSIQATTTVASSGGSMKTRPRFSRNDTVRLGTIDTTLILTIAMQSVAYVNQTVTMEVGASGVGDTIKNSLDYTWNFGDTYAGTGKKVTHRYEYPGTYVVTVRGIFGKHDTTIRQEITVLPVTVSLTRNDIGDVQIHNDAPYDIDISGYTITGERAVTFPLNSIIVPHGTITVASARLESVARSSMIRVYDQHEKLVVASNQATGREDYAVSTRNTHVPEVPVLKSTRAPSTRPLGASPFPTATATAMVTSFSFATTLRASAATETSPRLDSTESREAKDPTLQTERTGREAEGQGSVWPYVALLGLFGVALGALFLVPRRDGG